MPEGDFPPGVVCHKGFPSNSSPFLQALLPGNFKYENKRSRAVSYLKEGDVPMARGTTRSYDMALQAVLAWSWEWWQTLPTEKKSAIQSAKPGSGVTASKKRKVS